MKPRILALDPGPVQTGAAIYVGEQAYSASVEPNNIVLGWVEEYAKGRLGPPIDIFASEKFQHYGPNVPIGATTIESIYWLGQFIGTWKCHRNSASIRLVENTKIRVHFCQRANCGEPQIREALRIRLGKRPPASHAMSALAVAMYVADQERVFGSRWYQGAA